jgi:hypothetical protein
MEVDWKKLLVPVVEVDTVQSNSDPRIEEQGLVTAVGSGLYKASDHP